MHTSVEEEGRGGEGIKPQGVPLRILVVDSEDDAALLTRELGRGGYDPLLLERVDTPEGMERALREADGRGEPFEVVIASYGWTV